MMPSPRSSPAMRPASPLSPRYEPSRFESYLQPPSPRAMTPRGNASRRTINTSLRLPALPRFHPANFPSSHSSYRSTPEEEEIKAPLSPRTHQRMYSDAQKHLLQYHRDSVAAARATPQPDKPQSPRLVPIGSPGPVTPLELEGEEEYLIAGSKHAAPPNVSAQELTESLIREEARRSARAVAGSSSRQLRRW